MSRKKNVGGTHPSSERKAENSDFIGPSVYRDSIYKGNLYRICLLNMFMIWPCLAMQDQAQLICDSLTKRMVFIPLLILEILEFQESSTI